MRAAIVHNRASGAAGIEQVFAAIHRLYPAADVFIAPDHPAGFGNYDLVISTSLQAAANVAANPESLHVCYVWPSPRVDGEEPAQRGANRWAIPAPAVELDRTCGVRRAQARQWPGGVTHFIAASRTIQTRIALGTGRTCAVVHPPVRTEFYRPEFERRQGYYLMVARGISSRAQELAVAACRRLGRELMIIGKTFQQAANPRCQLLGEQPPEVLREHYRHCRALLFPGVSDFETAVLEAQACGTPVIALRQGSVIDLLRDAEGDGQGTGLFFHEPTPWSLASAMQELERRPHKLEPGLAVANALRFSTARFEREMSNLIAGLASQPAAREKDDRPRERKSAA